MPDLNQDYYVFSKIILNSSWRTSPVVQWLRIHNAGDMCSIPRSKKVSHAVGQLSPCATTTEPTRLEPMLHNKRRHCNENSAHCKLESSTHSPQLEKTCAAVKTQHSQKKKKKIPLGNAFQITICLLNTIKLSNNT